EVHMGTAHEAPNYLQKKVAGIQVHYLPVAYRQSMGLASRGRAFRGYVEAVLRWATTQSELPDRVYATSTPLTVGYLAYRLKQRYDIPYHFEVRDLWPDVPLQMLPALKLLAPIFRFWERHIYRHAEGVVALSSPMAETVQRRAPKVPVTLIPNMADPELFHPRVADAAWRKRWGIPVGHRVIAYTGSLGQANAPTTVLNFMELTHKAKLPIHWVLLGEGSYWEEVQEKAPENTSFFSLSSKADVAFLLGGADFALISFLENIPVLGSNSPNKLFDALASGCVILTNREGWYSQEVERAQAGKMVNKSTLILLLTEYLKNYQLLESTQEKSVEMGARFALQEWIPRWKKFINA
ncbi:MAG TPA: hypothetical protein DCR93_26030, partial [Cytophagales bacterium]|nr:hypothetical protein [Cytophagales bacterium]